MYYSTNTGNYAGMSTVAVSDRFIFNATGSYQSIHAQGSTQLGVTSGGRQEYSGRLSATDWELTLTNRYGGKTEVFSGYFEAVKGGRVLHLTNKAATGIQFHLGRSR